MSTSKRFPFSSSPRLDFHRENRIEKQEGRKEKTREIRVWSTYLTHLPACLANKKKDGRERYAHFHSEPPAAERRLSLSLSLISEPLVACLLLACCLPEN